jgi:hypothetical protein
MFPLSIAAPVSLFAGDYRGEKDECQAYAPIYQRNKLPFMKFGLDWPFVIILALIWNYHILFMIFGNQASG